MISKLLFVPVAIIKDAFTLGAIVNDGYFSNGNHTYTGKAIKDIAEEIKLNNDLRTLKKVTKTLRELQ